MKYNKALFNKAVKDYELHLKGHIEEKIVFVVSDTKNKDAFFSLAPLSRAVHNLKGDMHVIVTDRKSGNLQVLKDVWNVYEDKKSRLKTKKVNALISFIDSVNKRTKTKSFEDIFQGPEIYLEAKANKFHGTIDLPFHCKWHKKYRWADLLATNKNILKSGYALKKKEKFGLSFVLTPTKDQSPIPLEDYLDSFSIAYTMALSVKKLGANVGLSSSSDRFSMLAKSLRTVDLLSTLVGCELEKNINEDVFKKFKVFSKLLNLKRIEINAAVFGIHAKGYAGRFFFGEKIGYPTPNRKTRWSSPGQMLLKDRFEPQTRLESRPPRMRYAITETLPLDIYIETCNVSYDKLRKRNDKIKKIMNNSNKMRVIGKEIDGYKTDFTVFLMKPNGEKRDAIPSDADVTSMIDKDYLKKTGIKAGCYANFPSGESFVTPEKLKGLFIGDVVINVDQSYRIPKNNPLVIKVTEKGYKILKGPQNLIKKMKQERKESMQRIKNFELNKSLPKEITNMFRENFNSIGEFAINLNPKAKLCDYLIVNEKIARMIHIALGSGFEPDKKTVYHWDIVINSPKQKLDIYGIDKNNKVMWIIKKGKFVV